MKFAVAGLLALFAVCAQSHVLPYSAWPYASPYSWPYAHAPVISHAPITQYSSYPAVHIASPYHAPAAIQVAAPIAYHAAPAVVPVIKAAATYTAVNRGSVHTAPLEGHAISQTSLNLAPAPGTL